ncbi:hypothetical protein QBC34DRAFT_136889 [Podospora aff. communis PSN243]|uniref:EKC/KEOPS complex subunit GON7 n=1 Tax=Podospora aff. communis PSN243 TaxID=3040156 RepID=A0AAV9H1Q8_9PEZI|nr:hypothetical protein QBC34DRAFT_136889 [Podospora aff. communis PSN243]
MRSRPSETLLGMARFHHCSLSGPQMPWGEQTAAALEANLTSLENKLDELLASFGVPLEEEVQDKTTTSNGKPERQNDDKKIDGDKKANGGK